MDYVISIIKNENGKETVMGRLNCSAKQLFEPKYRFVEVLKILFNFEKLYKNNNISFKFELTEQAKIDVENLNHFIKMQKLNVSIFSSIVPAPNTINSIM